jgi:hypothetical protein
MSGNGKRQRQDRNDLDALSWLEEKAGEISHRQKVQRARSLTTALAKDQLFLEQMISVFEASFGKGKYQVGKLYRPKRKKKTERVVNVMISDTHFGAMLDPREVPIGYGRVEEARRLAAVCQQVAEYKVQYRDETELIVHMLGDVIQGQLHDKRDGEPLAEQFADAAHLLNQAIVFLAGHFKKVTVYCTPGNHGRNTARHNERATLQKWDAVENMLYTAVKIATAHIPNVNVYIPYTPYYVYDVFGMRGFMTHGDTVIKPGYPNRAIDVGDVSKQVNAINSRLELGERYALFGVGHVHVCSCTRLPNKVSFLSNGCLIPPDAYALSIGIFDTACCQAMWETVEGYIVGDRREAIVDEYTDKDKSLDKIIQPYRGM